MFSNTSFFKPRIQNPFHSLFLEENTTSQPPFFVLYIRTTSECEISPVFASTSIVNLCKTRFYKLLNSIKAGSGVGHANLDRACIQLRLSSVLNHFLLGVFESNFELSFAETARNWFSHTFRILWRLLGTWGLDIRQRCSGKFTGGERKKWSFGKIQFRPT